MTRTRTQLITDALQLNLESLNRQIGKAKHPGIKTILQDDRTQLETLKTEILTGQIDLEQLKPKTPAK